MPFRNATGLVWLGDELWATDWKEAALFRVSVKEGAVVATARVPLPSTHPTGLAVNGAEFYVSDSWAKLIQRWRLQGDEAVLTGSWPSPGPQPSALFHDGKSLWSADSSQNKLYRHASDPALTVVAAYETDFPVVGLWADSERLWSADTANRLVHRHRFDDALSLVASYGLPELDDGKARLSAFVMKDGTVWLGRDGDSRLLARPLSDFAERPFSPPPPAPAAP